MSKRHLFVGLVMALLFATVGQVFAYTTYGYNLTIPKLAGTTSTNNEAKTANCSNVILWVTAVGGNFTVNAGAQNASNQDISQYQRVTTGSAVSYPETIGNCGVGALRHIQFRTDINTLVDVQISGNWTPG
jgi:ABC-type uncharacterized transport system permease subunit